MSFQNRLISAALVAAVLLPGISYAAGNASPEDAYKAFASAMKDKDFKKGFAQVTPDSQDMLIGGLAISIPYMPVNDPTKRDEAQKILDKYGVKKMDPTKMTPGQGPQAIMKDMAGDVKDKPACIADLMDWMQKNSSQPGAGEQKFQAMGDSQLADVKISGDTATGNVKIKVGDKEESKPLDFKKVGDSWYLDFAAAVNAGAGAGARPMGSPGAGGMGK